jgi:hypothetical protein
MSLLNICKIQTAVTPPPFVRDKTYKKSKVHPIEGE